MRTPTRHSPPAECRAGVGVHPTGAVATAILSSWQNTCCRQNVTDLIEQWQQLWWQQ